jgi:hypothetical protein
MWRSSVGRRVREFVARSHIPNPRTALKMPLSETTVTARLATSIRSTFAIASAFCVGAGLWLASHHPLYPAAALGAFCVCVLATFVRPGSWLFLIPAAMPLLNFSPWTGWIAFDESDLLVVGAFAGSYASVAYSPTTLSTTLGSKGPDSLQRLGSWTIGMLGVVGWVAFCRGLGDVDLEALQWTGSYGDSVNSVRVFKPVLYALLAFPLIQRDLRDAGSTALATKRFASGMQVGLGFVVAAVCWERSANPGLLNFSSPYRTVSLFWEMHVGGAAIDAYMALAVPFVAWSLTTATSSPKWWASAVLALLTEYACLTTYSRGVYLATVGSLALLVILLIRYRHTRPVGAVQTYTARVRASLLALAMVLEAVLVLGSNTFMMGRLGASERDLHSRVTHWKSGLGLLHSPTDWAFGLGLGRLPARYAALVPGGKFPGSTRLSVEHGNKFVSLAGPNTIRSGGGLYGLTQRLPIRMNASQRLEFDARSARPIRLRLSVCEMHLLYEGRCQVATAEAEPTAPNWRSLSVTLTGPRLSAGPWYAPHQQVLSISVLDENSSVDLDNFSLHGDDGVELLRNAAFSQSLARWFPVSRGQFLPWHIDSLYLELLIERGLLGLVTFLVLIASAVLSLAVGLKERAGIAPFFIASLTGCLTIGLVSSVMDVPRVAFLVLLLVLISIRTKWSRAG